MNSKKLVPVLLDNMIWILLAGAVIVFSLLNDRFLTQTNITSTFVHAAALGIMVIGQSFTLITGNFDLSAESTLGLTAFLGAWLVAPAVIMRGDEILQAHGSGLPTSPLLAVATMLALGVLIGWLNGFLITRLKMNNFIVTLAMLIILRGMIMVVTEGNTVTNIPASFEALGHDALGPVPISVLVCVLAFVVAHIVTQFRPFGRDLYAVGGNPMAALASGVEPNQRVRQAYMLSGALAAFAAWLLVGRQGAVPPNMGEGMIFEVQAAAVIGGVSLFGGRGTMLGAFGGVLLLSVIDSGLRLMQVSVFWIDAVRGLIILFAMLIDAQKVRYAAPLIPAATLLKSTALQEPS